MLEHTNRQKGLKELHYINNVRHLHAPLHGFEVLGRVHSPQNALAHQMCRGATDKVSIVASTQLLCPSDDLQLLGRVETCVKNAC